jgi:hypothetical protein
MARPRPAWTGALAANAALATGVAGQPARAANVPCAMPPRPEGLLGATVGRVVDRDTLIVRLGAPR